MNALALPSTGIPPRGGWAPCSDRSLERNDPLAGTGGFGERWFLVEIDGSWGQHAFLNSRLDPQLAHDLVHRIEGGGMRPLAIRRVNRRADARRAQSSWRWAIVDTRPGLESTRWGSVNDPAHLLDVPLDGSTGVASDEPVICVCTHARHDQCCAVRGRPVATAMASAFPDETWECSHLGGDRFAATLILFPAGLYYGRASVEDAPGLVERYREGRLDPRTFRGRSSSPNLVQVAEAVARTQIPDDSISAFSHRSTMSEPGGWRVTLAHGDQDVVVRLAASMSAPLLTTCEATVALPVREYELVSVSVGAAGAARRSA
ncbi:MAG TPA: sucrase ferredoxin [Galbitalea sp.]